MPTLRAICVSTVVGVFLALGWWAFIDGAIHAPDVFEAAHLAPPLTATMAGVLFNLVGVSHINGQNAGAVRVWLFTWFTVACTAIGGAIWIAATGYPPDDNWPGVSIVLCCVSVFFASTLFFVGRKNVG